MFESRVSFVCSFEKMKELAPLLLGEVSMLHIEPVDKRSNTPGRLATKSSGLQARDRIEAVIQANFDDPDFEITRQDLRQLLAGFGFKSPNASVTYAMPALVERYGLEVVGTSLWRMPAARRSAARADNR